jgi:stage III sporulation protein AD
MELLIKCVSLAVFGVLVILLLRRWNPELSFALSAVCVLVLLLSSGAVIEELLDSLREVQRIFQSSAVHARPMLKCLGIAFISKFGADLCRDASQSALASAVETAGNLCAAALAMPLIISLMTTIGGML